MISFGYIMIIVTNMEKSIDFYRTLLKKEPDFSSPRWSQFTLGSTLLGLHAANSWSDPNDPLRPFGPGQKGESIGLWTDNLDNFLNHLKEQKIKVVHGPRITGLGNTIYIIDPDGYYIQICQRVKR